jgi:hypothetical protein
MSCYSCEKQAKQTDNQKLGNAKQRAIQWGKANHQQVVAIYKAKNGYGIAPPEKARERGWVIIDHVWTGEGSDR